MTTSGKNGGSEAMLKTVLYLPEGARRHAAVVERLMESGPERDDTGTVPRRCVFWAHAHLRSVLSTLRRSGRRSRRFARFAASSRRSRSRALFNPASPLIAADAMSAGAIDVLPWPFEARDAATLLANARDLQPVPVANRDESDAGDGRSSRSRRPCSASPS